MAANIREIFPAMAIDDATLAEIAGYPIKHIIVQPPAINVAAKMFGQAVGYREHAIRKLIPTHLPDWAKRLGPIKRLARETATELTRKK